MLVKPRLVWFQHKNWAYGLGFLSGVLAGAYNIGGPPAVVYATGKRWPPVTAKSNLQLISLLSGFLVIATRATNQEFTEIVMGHYLLGLPAIVIGLWVGFSSDGWLNGEGFRRGMLLLLLLIGLHLLI